MGTADVTTDERAALHACSVAVEAMGGLIAQFDYETMIDIAQRLLLRVGDEIPEPLRENVRESLRHFMRDLQTYRTCLDSLRASQSSCRSSGCVEAHQRRLARMS